MELSQEVGQSPDTKIWFLDMHELFLPFFFLQTAIFFLLVDLGSKNYENSGLF